MTPDGWQNLTLGHLTTVRRGASPRPIQDPRWFSDRGPGWVRISDVTRASRVLWSTKQYLSPEGVAKSVRLCPGELVLSIAATIGKPIILGIDACIHDGFVYFENLNTQRVATDFLYYVFQHREPELSGQGQPGTQKNINTSIVENLPLCLPPLGEQKKIAAILSSVDDAIEASQAAIDQLGVVKKAMMAELLTRGIPGRHTRFKQTEIGEIPEAWGVVRCDDALAEGPSNGRSPQSRAMPPGVPTFSIGAVRDGRVNIRDSLKYADATSESVRSALVRQGDILIVRGNGNPEFVGRCGVVSEQPPDGCIYPDILMRIRPTDSLRATYLVPLWNSEIVHKQILDRAKTTNGTYKVNGEDVRSILLPLPSLAEQEQLAGAAEAFASRILAESEQVKALCTVKAALMSVLLTGEVRVKPDDVLG
ncbi:MAG: hypothetical protein JWP97_6213 [Labilithrix sp.]|nr:hypothetical protein [Labilithrix sp.]